MADTKDVLKRIEDKIDRLDSRVDNVDVTLAKQHMSLEEHMKRSLANEQAVEVLSSSLKPVFDHVTIVNFVFRVLLFAVGSGFMWVFVKSN